MTDIERERENWESCRKRRAPRYLYTYRPIDDYLRDTIISRQVYLSDPLSFNDPFDCQLPVEFTSTPENVKRHTEDILSRHQQRFDDPIKFQQIANEARALAERGEMRNRRELEVNMWKGMRNNGIICFSETPRDILMWSHYASKHQGVCLQFDTRIHGNWMRDCAAVYYSGVCPRLNWIEDDQSELFDRLVLTKSSHWKYEREWRMFFNTPQISRLQSFPPNALRSIIFGYQCPASRVREIELLLKSSTHETSLLQAIRNHTRFEIGIFPLGWQGVR